MSKKKGTEITTPLQVIGRDLMEDARDRFATEGKNKLVTEVADLLRKISECERTIAMATAGLAYFKAQKEAIEQGEFTLHNWTGKIVYKNPELNESYQKILDGGFISTRVTR